MLGKIVVFILFVALASAIVGYTLLSRTYIIHNYAAIKAVNVGVYKEVGCQTPLTVIDWGILEPGECKNYTAYVRNEANVPVTLSLSTGNWNPESAGNWITLTWDYGGETLKVGEVVSVTFTLTVDQQTTGITNFTFDITIAAVG